MADFSFSFDSDNPFAEPDAAPKPAPATDKITDKAADEVAGNSDALNGQSATAPAEQTSAPDDEFSLDSFDFSFEEGPSINDSLPTQTMPVAAAPRQQTPGEAALADFDFGAPDEGALEFGAPDEDVPAENSLDLDALVADASVADASVADASGTEVPGETALNEDTLDEDAFDFDSFGADASAAEVPGADDFAEDAFAADLLEAELVDADAFAASTSDAEITSANVAPEGVPEVAASAIEVEAPAPDFGDAASDAATDAASKAAKRNSDLDEFNAINFETANLPDETQSPVVPDANGSAFSLDFENLDQEIESNPETVAIADDEMSTGETPLATEISLPDEIVASTFFPTFLDDAQAENESEVASEIENQVETTGETPLENIAEVPNETAVETPSDISGGIAAEPPARPRRLKTSFNVAILGAAGIGKNHARWFHRNNCRVVGFLGTSGDSTAQTEADLAADFPFDGTAYTDLGELLKQEKPDIVCVATPPSLHFGHVLQSLEAGAHVLCEKPLVYAPTRKFRENRDGAKELVKVAAKKKLVLATQLQYGAATPILCKLAGLSPADVGDFAMELETLNPNSSRDPRELWIDLGPHPISVAQMLAGPGAQLAEETIRFEPLQSEEKTEVLVRFGINCADGRLLMVRAAVRSLSQSTRQPRRRFSFNGHSVIYAPLDNGKGNYQAQFVAPDGYASVYADPVDYLIGDFVRACREARAPLISGDFGRENLEWMLKVAGDK